MSTFAFRAALVREVEQAMEQIDSRRSHWLDAEDNRDVGRLDAYAHILMLLKDEDL